MIRRKRSAAEALVYDSPMTLLQALRRIAVVSFGLLGMAVPTANAGVPATGVWGEITGERQSHSTANRAGTTIKMIDGSAVLERQPRVRVGSHTIIVHWTPKRGLRTSDRTLRLDVRSCKRYYVNAQFASPGSSLWQPVVDKVEDIPGCGAAAPGSEIPGKSGNPTSSEPSARSPGAPR